VVAVVVVTAELVVAALDGVPPAPLSVPVLAALAVSPPPVVVELVSPRRSGFGGFGSDAQPACNPAARSAAE
jgi:hypothetical protein